MPRTSIDLDLVLDRCRKAGRITAPALAEHLDVSPGRARKALDRLADDGKLIIAHPGHRGRGCARVFEFPGLDRRTLPRMHKLTRASDDLGADVSYDDVRTIVYKWRERDFTVADLADQLGCSRSSANKQILKLLHYETVVKVAEGKPGRASRYQYNPPPAHRQVASHGCESSSQPRRGSAEVAGTGKRNRFKRETREQVALAKESGMEIKRGSKHWKVLKDGKLVTVIGTPDDARTVKNGMASIKRAA